MLKIIACDDDVAFLDRLHRMIDRWSTETGTAVDVALVTRGEDLLARHAASRADIILLVYDHAARQRHGHRTRTAPGRHRRAPGVPHLVARVRAGILRGPRLRLSAQARDLRTPGAITRRAFEHAPGGNRRARDQNFLWLPRPAPVRHRICRGAQQARGLPPARRTRYRGARVVPQRRAPLGAKRGLL